MKHIIILWLAMIPLIARAENKAEDTASITWKLYKMDVKGEPDKMAFGYQGGDGESFTAGFEYYWNGEMVGQNLDGLAGLYDRIKAFKGTAIVLHFRTFDPSPRGLGWTVGPNITKHLEHYENLLRERKISFTIQYSDHPLGQYSGYDSIENPFLKMKEQQKKQ